MVCDLTVFRLDKKNACAFFSCTGSTNCGCSSTQVALWTLGQLVASTGYVVEPYRKYPTLLEVLLNFLKTEQNQGTRREVHSRHLACRDLREEVMAVTHPHWAGLPVCLCSVVGMVVYVGGVGCRTGELYLKSCLIRCWGKCLAASFLPCPGHPSVRAPRRFGPLQAQSEHRHD